MTIVSQWNYTTLKICCVVLHLNLESVRDQMEIRMWTPTPFSPNPPKSCNCGDAHHTDGESLSKKRRMTLSKPTKFPPKSCSLKSLNPSLNVPKKKPIDPLKINNHVLHNIDWFVIFLIFFKWPENSQMQLLLLKTSQRFLKTCWFFFNSPPKSSLLEILSKPYLKPLLRTLLNFF